MKQRWYTGLRLQTLMLLTVALLPIGSVAIFQTNQVAKDAIQNQELALLALTEKAAKTEELLIERAIGVARFFATIVPDFAGNPQRCQTELAKFITESDSYSFIGVLPKSGVMECSSTSETVDFSQYPDFEQNMADQKSTITVNTDATISGQSVFIVSEPYFIDGDFGGFISISIPHRVLPGITEYMVELGLQELITFNTNGTLLTSRQLRDEAMQQLPIDYDLTGLKSLKNSVFQADNTYGQERTYTVVPVIGSPVNIVGVWNTEKQLSRDLASFMRAAIFPALMWLASMAVAMLAIYTLVLRHITKLRTNMDEFAVNRFIEKTKETRTMPNEFQALRSNFLQMTDDIVREEAAMENALREKNVLIKEVHHRVKNNLQLISSIMNMHIRTAEQEETRSVLSRLQDRVLSLATIHRDLYQPKNGGLVNAGNLVKEIVQKTTEIGATDAVDITTDIDKVMLYPDQAVPLSLMMSEAVTNAIKYHGSSSAQKPWVSVTLKQEGKTCAATIANSKGKADQEESTGLGAQLIKAFAIQLGGKIIVDDNADTYKMSVTFEIEDFVHEARDY